MSESRESRRHERFRLEGDHFALIQLPAGDERLEPLLDLSATGVAVLMRSPQPVLQPGMILPRVRIFRRGECALDTQANVRDVTQVSLEGGGVGQKLGLLLETPQGRRQVAAAIDKYEQPAVITAALTDVIHNRARANLAPAGAESTTNVATGVFNRVSPQSDSFYLELDRPGGNLLAKHPYDLHTEYRGRRLALTAYLLACEETTLRFGWPTALQVWRARVGPRLRALPQPISVRFETPFHREERVCEAVDLAARGVAFECRPGDGLMVGLVLPGMVVEIPGERVVAHRLVARGLVRHLRYDDHQRLIAGVELTGMVSGHERILASYLDAQINPSVRAARLEDLTHLWRLYQQTGLLAPGQKISAIEATRRRLLRRGGDLLLQVIGGAEDEIQGTAELLHTYPVAWSLQHVGLLASSRLTPDQLLVPAIGGAMQQASCQYLHALLDPEQPSGLDRLREIAPSSNSLMWREWVLFTTPAGYRPPASLADDLHDADAADLDWIGTKVATRFAPLERGALALEQKGMGLGSMRRFYGALGLERRRVVRIAVGVGGPLGFSLIEQSSPGFNFEGYCDLARLIPTMQLVATRDAAAVTLAHDAVAIQRDANLRVLLMVPDELAAALQEAGFVGLGRRVEIFADRDGASQVINFINLLGSAHRSNR